MRMELYMKIVVLIKRTPDTEAVIKVNDNNKIDSSKFKYIINPYDEYAIEEALRIKAKNSAEVIVASFGPQASKECLLKALAMGVDKAIHIACEDVGLFDSLTTAKVLVAMLKKEQADVILCGRQGIDDDNMHVGIMVAELMNLPHVNGVTKVELLDKEIRLDREIEGGQKEHHIASLPIVIGAHKSLNKPRYASLPGIMRAKRKPYTVLSLEDLDLELNSLVKANRVVTVAYKRPPEKPKGKILKDEPIEVMVDKMVDFLKNEAKVI
jgi:electron transfer flavoprotein beta subunit